MGISNSCIRLLMREGNRENFSGRVLQLGRQTVEATEQSIEKIAKEEKFKLSKPNCDIEHDNSPPANTITVNDKYLFQRLGFEVVDSLDFNTFEGANVIHDLNKLLTKELTDGEPYDFIYDGGTIEHIFNVPNALKNIFDLLSVGGRVAHLSPVKFINHGFYNFSTFFYEEFYDANKFLINECGIIKIPTNRWNDNDFYTSGDKNSQFARSANPTLLNGANFLTNFIATKTRDSTGDKTPQQGFFRDAWDSSTASEKYGNSGLVHGSSVIKSVYGKLATVPVLRNIVKFLRDRYANALVKWEII